MNNPNLMAPCQVTGLRRAFFEISIGISAQKALEQMQMAMMQHAARALTYRLILEMATSPEAYSMSACLNGGEADGASYH